LFVASGAGTILKFAPGGTQSVFASGLSVPYGLAFDSSGNLFAADGGNGIIFKFAPDGTKTIFATGFFTVNDLAFDARGNLYEENSATGMIFKYTPAGTRTTLSATLALVALAIVRDCGHVLA
jgi:hypothetical protein